MSKLFNSINDLPEEFCQPSWAKMSSDKWLQKLNDMAQNPEKYQTSINTDAIEKAFNTANVL